jgi:N-methylhydantoinase B/oxoprolinase/acetone carboxylase alpha subunit
MKSFNTYVIAIVVIIVVINIIFGGGGYSCMNNLTFGDGSMGYYETIAGGSGAGPT